VSRPTTLDGSAEAEDLAAYAAGDYNALDAPPPEVPRIILEVESDQLQRTNPR
jgi:hypothetical protein